MNTSNKTEEKFQIKKYGFSESGQKFCVSRNHTYDKKHFHLNVDSPIRSGDNIFMNHICTWKPKSCLSKQQDWPFGLSSQDFVCRIPEDLRIRFPWLAKHSFDAIETMNSGEPDYPDDKEEYRRPQWVRVHRNFLDWSDGVWKFKKDGKTLRHYFCDDGIHSVDSSPDIWRSILHLDIHCRLVLKIIEESYLERCLLQPFFDNILNKDIKKDILDMVEIIEKCENPDWSDLLHFIGKAEY